MCCYSIFEAGPTLHEIMDLKLRGPDQLSATSLSFPLSIELLAMLYNRVFLLTD